MFGREDIDVIAPVVESYRAAGMDVAGPVPADTIYVKALAGQFDAVVAMYHDQGHIVVKTLGFVMDPNSGQMSALSASTSRSACRSCAPRSTTARRSTSRARASPTRRA